MLNSAFASNVLTNNLGTTNESFSTSSVGGNTLGSNNNQQQQQQQQMQQSVPFSQQSNYSPFMMNPNQMTGM